MPFTPFHMGPGCVAKAVLGRHFSLTVFGFAQVAIDLEALVRLMRRDAILHGWTHTFLGATGIAAVSVLVGRPVCQRLLDHCAADADLRKWLRGPRTITWLAAICGAFFGTYSHIFLDCIMHFDMRPFAPFAQGNPWLDLVAMDKLHLLCVAAGVVGLAGVYGRFSRTA